jgi:hypothetical protein
MIGSWRAGDFVLRYPLRPAVHVIAELNHQIADLETTLADHF